MSGSSIPLRCHIPGLFDHLEECRRSVSGSILDETTEMYLGRRGGTDPYGQVLPDWLTWAEYTTTIAEEVITTGSIAQLPLTYYGPSIPLGPDWVYGGLTSPAATPTVDVAPTTGVQASAPPSDTAESSPSVTDSEASGSATPSSLPFVTTSASASISPSSELSVTTISSEVMSSIPSTPSSPAHPVSGSSPTGDSAATITPLSSSSASPSSTVNPDIGANLLPLLPALLTPLLFLLLVALLVVYVIFRRRSQDSESRPNGSSRLPAWLATILHPSRRGYQPTPTPSTPVPKEGENSPDPRSPNEKSALLPGFTPHHHRSSSSISGADEDLSILAKQSQSLLHRLTLGLGWLTPTSSRETRKPSGFTLERGLRSASDTDVPPSTKRQSGGTADSHGQGENTSSGVGTSSGALRSMTDEQLFYRPPVPTVSSKRTSTGSALTSSSSGVGHSRKSWLSRLSRTAIPQAGPSQVSDGDEISLAVPDTPGTAGSGEIGEFAKASVWKEGGERMRFPVPPKSPVSPMNASQDTFGARPSRNSGASSGSDSEQPSSFHTASSSSDIQKSRDLSTGSATYGTPITRTDEAYRHAPLSVFGSHPSTPAQSPRLGHASREHSESPAISPQSIPPPRIASPLGQQWVSHHHEDALRPMAPLFAITPPASPPRDDTRGEYRGSFPGEPLVDMTLLSAGRGANRQVSIGEFGEPLRPGPDVTPTTRHPARMNETPSETASVYSGPSRATSRGGTESSGSHSHASREDPSIAVAVSDRALRGRRSQPQLLRASMLGIPERPLPVLPSLTPDIARAETPKGRKSWFGGK